MMVQQTMAAYMQQFADNEHTAVYADLRTHASGLRQVMVKIMFKTLFEMLSKAALLHQPAINCSDHYV